MLVNLRDNQLDEVLEWADEKFRVLNKKVQKTKYATKRTPTRTIRKRSFQFCFGKFGVFVKQKIYSICSTKFYNI